ncbi:hypothetical protein HGI30_15980 [Paenibacillus albicereus]|uniref:Uncharacterized protein n=1 Tax=Paenibacillus albicereus TaxID=2726185 RepID=A0A6H2H0P0_9BACL|nr:hypothetical protein [Paenibacillus albicereus]QJC52918.1 hypothetical protein HGI30_15980 [Paenibacillus albicereus]
MKKRTVKIFKAISGLTVLIFILFFGFMLLVGVNSVDVLKDSIFMNRVALILGALSIPGLLTQLLDIIHEDKKEFTATTCCPNCKHNVEIRLSEKS